MFSKPTMIGKSTAMPDYGSFVRQNISAQTLGQETGFSSVLEAQQGAQRQNIAGDSPHSRDSAPPTAEAPLNRTSGGQSFRGSLQDIAPEYLTRRSPLAMAQPLNDVALAETAKAAPESRPNTAEEVPREIAVAKALSGGGILLDQRSLRTLERLKNDVLPRHSAVKKTSAPALDDDLGSLSAQYESGSKGSSAIGYDSNGGTSYGTYQISSKQGTFTNFLKFLDTEEPAMATRLRKAGPANTGGRSGAVPREWQAIAAEQPERFGELQKTFIQQSHYAPAAESLKGLLGVPELSSPLQQVVWSTAVQHGPTGAQKLFTEATTKLERKNRGAQQNIDEKALIETVYTLRKGQFSNSTPSVQNAVRSRLESESRQAVALLKGKTSPRAPHVESAQMTIEVKNSVALG